MSVIAKMRVTALTRRHLGLWDGQKSVPGEHQGVSLQAVADDANKSWSEATPSGQIELTITNQEALKQFELGKCYLIEFKPADE